MVWMAYDNYFRIVTATIDSIVSTGIVTKELHLETVIESLPNSTSIENRLICNAGIGFACYNTMFVQGQLTTLVKATQYA